MICDCKKNKLGQEMIWAGRQSEYHQKQGNIIMYNYWHDIYINLQKKYFATRKT